MQGFHMWAQPKKQVVKSYDMLRVTSPHCECCDAVHMYAVQLGMIVVPQCTACCCCVYDVRPGQLCSCEAAL
jgi:hypothetical protein